MPNVVCPQCGRAHYQKKDALIAVCYGCGWRWTANEAKQGKPYPLDKFPGGPGAMPGGGRQPKEKGPKRPVGRPPKEEAQESPEEGTPKKRKKLWEMEF